MTANSYEQSLISILLNDPQPLPEIFKFLSWDDFEDNEYQWIYASFVATYSGMTMDTAVWLKKMFTHLVEASEVNETECRIQLRGLADGVMDGSNAVLLARQVRKQSLHRKMQQTADEWARFDVYRDAGEKTQ